MSETQAAQNGTRVMKFLKFCSEDDDDQLTKEHVDYCIGSAALVCNFIEHIVGRNGVSAVPPNLDTFRR